MSLLRILIVFFPIVAMANQPKGDKGWSCMLQKGPANLDISAGTKNHSSTGSKWQSLPDLAINQESYIVVAKDFSAAKISMTLPSPAEREKNHVYFVEFGPWDLFAIYNLETQSAALSGPHGAVLWDNRTGIAVGCGPNEGR